MIEGDADWVSWGKTGKTHWYGVQRFFDFLPAPFNGFGVIANYTFSDGQGDGGKPLVGLSRHS